MQINIKATNMELTPAIQAHIEERVASLEKFVPKTKKKKKTDEMPHEPIQVWVEVGKSTEHHHKGEIFLAEIQVRVPNVKESLRTVSNREDLYTAIDDARDQMKRELRRRKEKKIDLIRGGARKVKNLISFWRGER